MYAGGNLERHHDLLESGIAGTFPEAIDGHVNRGNAGTQASNRVGRGHSEIVVRVQANLDCGQSSANRAQLAMTHHWVPNANRVCDAQAFCATLERQLPELLEPSAICSRSILRTDRDVCEATYSGVHECLRLLQHPGALFTEGS
jgi:hypothetical protein